MFAAVKGNREESPAIYTLTLLIAIDMNIFSLSLQPNIVNRTTTPSFRPNGAGNACAGSDHFQISAYIRNFEASPGIIL